MYIKIRNLAAKPGDEDLILTLSKTTKIQEMRSMIEKELSVNPERQRLFYKGKLLIDDHALFEYDVQLNDVIQLMVRDVQAETKNETKNDTEEKPKIKTTLEEVDTESEYYKVGERVDMQDMNGAWYEATIEKIVKNPNTIDIDIPSKEPDLLFKCLQDHISYPVRIDCTFDFVRPRAYYVYQMKELSPGMTVLVNYNVDAPKERGYWYDFKISIVMRLSIKGTLFLGRDKAPLKDISIKLIDEVYRIQKPTENLSLEKEKVPETIPARKIPFNCTKCKDDINRKCRECGCKICHAKNNVELILLCDECDGGFHIGCLDPPLLELPEEDEWYCPKCKIDDNEIVKAGDKLKKSNKKSKMPSAKAGTSNRDWGKGMACVGRTKECTIAKKDHLGPVPGIEVGTCWLYRQQVSEAGIHRPLVAGIHGSEKHFAYSIVLSGGYEDDVDNGDEFFYTGSGGRDLSGNKRVSEQSCDQKLTRMNKALAMNCNAKFNEKTGAEAKDWKGGKPIRVVRNYKAAKHSKYAPKEGNRYDGIYKVVKYYPEKGLSGFIVWRYLLRRDDNTPAPWHKGGKEYEMIYPPGYQELQEKNKLKELEKKKGNKRVLTEMTNTPAKKMKTEAYILPDDLQKLIDLDAQNEKLWEECKETLKDGKIKFYEKVQDVFICICCQDVVHLPITTGCGHNICKNCLRRSFASEIYTCPHCRAELGKNYDGKVNENLRGALKVMFPNYEDSR